MKNKKLNVVIGVLLFLAVLFHFMMSLKIWERANIICELLFCTLFFLKFIQCKKNDKKEAYGFLFLAILFFVVFFAMILG